MMQQDSKKSFRLYRSIAFLAIALVIVAAPAKGNESPLTDEERRLIERYEAQEQAYQAVAMKQLQSQIKTLERDIREIKRDKEKAEPVRDRAVLHLQGQIEHLEQMMTKMSDGELTLPAQLDYQRIRTGNFGTLHPIDSQFTGYGYTTSLDSISGYRYVYDLNNRDQGHIAYLQVVDTQGKNTQQIYGVVFEVVERLDRYKDKPTFRLRAVNIETLRVKRALELEKEREIKPEG